MCINGSLEEEQAGCAGIKRDGDCHQHTLTGSKHATYWTEAHASRYIGKSDPVQVAPVAWVGNDTGETDVRAIFIAIEMSNNAH